MSDTIAVVDDEKNSGSIDYEPSSITNSKVYNKITPWVLISLGTFYMSFLLFRYCSWRFRRLRIKRIRMERQKVEKFWRKRSACLNALTETSSTVPPPTQAVFDEEKYTQRWSPSFDSSATLVGIVYSSDYYLSEQRHLSLAESLMEVDVFMEQEQESLPYYLKHHNTMHESRSQIRHSYTQQAIRTSTIKRRKSRKERLTSTLINRINGNHQRKKKRQLLWQWSVAMGYCRYSHGHHLNTMIQRLVEEKRQRSINNSASEEQKQEHANADDRDRIEQVSL